MSQAQTFYEDHFLYEGLTWSFVKEQIGQGLRERYELPTELSSKLLALIRKLEAAENKSSPAHVDRNAGHSRRLLFEALCDSS